MAPNAVARRLLAATAERDELLGKIEQLKSFIGESQSGKLFNVLLVAEQVRLMKQLAFIELYLAVLNKRRRLVPCEVS
jgi:hypothetical protein